MVRVKQPGHTLHDVPTRDRGMDRQEGTPTRFRAWIHPGMAANPIMGSVVAFVEPHVEKAIDQLVAHIGGGAYGQFSRTAVAALEVYETLWKRSATSTPARRSMCSMACGLRH